MKTVLVILLSALCSIAFAQRSNSYGKAFDITNVWDVKDLDKLMKSTDSLSAIFSGNIEQSCGAKGCWMTLQNNNNQTLRVTFENYGFFVPTDGLEGKKTTFKGYCKKQETSVAELRHYAQDAGKSQDEIAMITEPKIEYKFVATGVVIED